MTPAADNGVSVVIPVFNEAEAIGDLLREVFAALGNIDEPLEVVVVDDGSTDSTPDVLARCRRELGERLRVLRHRQQSGQSAGIRTAVLAARQPWIATLDGDGQNDPADIPTLLAQRRAPSTGAPRLVCGYRRRRRDSLLKRFSSRVANHVRSRLLDDGILDTGCGLKVFPRDAFVRVPWFDHMHRFLPALMRREGLEVVAVDVNHRPRLRGVSKYGVGNRLWVGIVDMLGVMWLQRRAKLTASDEMENA